VGASFIDERAARLPASLGLCEHRPPLFLLEVGQVPPLPRLTL
jgi:hypothetical protein